MSFDLKLYQGDFLLDSAGRPVRVIESQKLTQDVLKIILTEKGSNPYHPRYGSYVHAHAVGQSFSNSFIIKNKVYDSVDQAVQYLQQLQDQQRLTQRVDPAELILAIEDSHVWVDEADPRQYNVNVVVLSEYLTNIETSFAFTLQDISA